MLGEVAATAPIKTCCLGLIQLKRAAGRPKDLEDIAELDALREENR